MILHLNNLPEKTVIASDLLKSGRFLFWVVLGLCCILAGCSAVERENTPYLPNDTGLEMATRVTSTNQVKILPPAGTPTIFTPTRLTSTVIPSSTFAPTATIPAPSLIPTESPDPYEEYTIDYLASRQYGSGGEIKVESLLDENSYFSRHLFSYPSDGLNIYGFMNIPKNVPEGSLKLPVVIALHGYIDPQVYNTIDYTTRYADALARSGFIVLHPNLRNYPPSDQGPDLFRVGMAVDVLNLISIIKDQSFQGTPLEKMDHEAIGLWGHSMGGGISTRVMTLSPDIKAVLLYGAMGADDLKNYERIYGYFSNGERGKEELDAPPEAFERISPVNYLERVRIPVSIHHGKLDPDVPLAWSIDLCYRLRDLGVPVECFVYDDQAHTFHDEGDTLFIQRMIEFYDRILRGD